MKSFESIVIVTIQEIHLKSIFMANFFTIYTEIVELF